MESQGPGKGPGLSEWRGSSGTGLNPQEGKARGLQDGFRVTVPGFWLVSQGILFTAASTEHEAEFLEV